MLTLVAICAIFGTLEFFFVMMLPKEGGWVGLPCF